MYDKNPKIHSDSKLIKQVDIFNDKLEQIAEDIDGGISFGGMKSKIQAIKKITTVGIPAIITSYNNNDLLERLLDGEELGTYFLAQK